MFVMSEDQAPFHSMSSSFFSLKWGSRPFTPVGLWRTCFDLSLRSAIQRNWPCISQTRCRSCRQRLIALDGFLRGTEVCWRSVSTTLGDAIGSIFFAYSFCQLSFCGGFFSDLGTLVLSARFLRWASERQGLQVIQIISLSQQWLPRDLLGVGLFAPRIFQLVRGENGG